MADMLKEDGNLVVTDDRFNGEDDTLAVSDSLNGEDDQIPVDDLETLKLEFLDRSAPISNARRAVTIEETRERVVQSTRTIRIGEFNGKKRVGIQRNGISLVMFELPSGLGLNNDQIREAIRKRIRNGEFDHQITTLYDQLRNKQSQ